LHVNNVVDGSVGKSNTRAHSPELIGSHLWVLFCFITVESSVVAFDISSKTVAVVACFRSVKLSDSYSRLVILAWQRSPSIVVIAMQWARAIPSALWCKCSNRMSFSCVDQSAFRVPIALLLVRQLAFLVRTNSHCHTVSSPLQLASHAEIPMSHTRSTCVVGIGDESVPSRHEVLLFSMAGKQQWHLIALVACCFEFYWKFDTKHERDTSCHLTTMCIDVFHGSFNVGLLALFGIDFRHGDRSMFWTFSGLHLSLNARGLSAWSFDAHDTGSDKLTKAGHRHDSQQQPRCETLEIQQHKTSMVLINRFPGKL
jgi:hypothetical protein